MAHVEGDDVLGAQFEQHLGEPTRRGAHVETPRPRTEAANSGKASVAATSFIAARPTHRDASSVRTSTTDPGRT
ncbi:hypothetical protein GCM10025883_20310 [Mobilicoccus caccae]|uniref:Uncharacterized protein n=1 Tax=Mobilicoccus caccae TaxID=1859295 RepID=A0ABQ6IQJ0_9MICO|nr:hypothetical protein GCM10025883_20310 [Mobilicoccus caccae]